MCGSQIKWKAVLYIQKKTVLLRHQGWDPDCGGLQIKWQEDEYMYMVYKTEKQERRCWMEQTQDRIKCKKFVLEVIPGNTSGRVKK